MARIKMKKRNPPASKRHNPKPARRSASEQKRIVAERAEARKALRIKKDKAAKIQFAKDRAIKEENDKARVETLLANTVFADFISKNVGKRAISIIRMLHASQTDEKIAGDLQVKINEVRRILNVLDSYGVARYDTSKDSKGWLTFNWYLDSEKLSELNQSVMNAKPEGAYRLPEDCNDFFYCAKCYEESKVIMPFDAAFESQFKCESCGKSLKQLNKDEATAIFEQSVAGNGVPALKA